MPDAEWYPCGWCGARYRSRRTAMQCCSECFDDLDPDHDPRSPPVAMTDGGHCAGAIRYRAEAPLEQRLRDRPTGGDR